MAITCRAVGTHARGPVPKPEQDRNDRKFDPETCQAGLIPQSAECLTADAHTRAISNGVVGARALGCKPEFCLVIVGYWAKTNAISITNPNPTQSES